jgi:acyl transferase domain-containing protein/NAD(P)-dependent dehydrogenase (short-subunit alcohol dehydrogenase family)
MRKYYYTDDRIAIVGMGGIFPDANDIQAFWQNILTNKVSIRELPDSIFRAKIHYRPDLFKKINKEDKTYTRMASMVDYETVLAANKRFKIPPAVAEHMDKNQHAAIYCVDQALQSLRGRALSNERTAVILGNGNPGAHFEHAIERVFYAVVQEYLRNNPILLEKLGRAELEKVLQALAAEVLKDTLPLTEDSAPGMLQNLVAGRIANVFGFQGPSFMIDAACASSLAAVIAGVQGLQRREYDAVITGGIDLGLQTAYFAAFSAINALSPEGSFPFDTRANGFIIGSGGGVIILKRLEDALQDQDNIIALISGYGQGSDGKGKYIAAPNEDGQARVVEAACRMAGYPVDTIELMEAHGTGTSVGDVVEVKGLKKAFSALGFSKTNYCGLGSVKSNIGHLKAAAGAPGIIKASLGLYHKILPPTANVQQINPKLQLEASPFYILTEKRDWPEHPDYPRRANVSAFGFGGTDFHIALEEFRSEFRPKVYAFPSVAERSGESAQSFEQGWNEVVLFSGETLDSISELYRRFQAEAGRLSFSQHSFRHNAKMAASQKVRLAICARSYEDLAAKWAIFEAARKESGRAEWESLALQGIYYHDGPVVTSDQMALLFPGQASQYPNMGRDLARTFPAIQSLYAQVDALWDSRYGYTISSLIFGEDEAALDAALKDTKNTHPAVFLSSIALFKLLSEAGVRADYLIGHSLGEMTALYAGGMLDLPSAVQLIGARGFSFDAIPAERRGRMVSIKADRKAVEKLLNDLKLEVYIANLNSPDQTVVGGGDSAVDQLDQALATQKIPHTTLNVSHAFHTPLVADAAAEFYRQIVDLPFAVPRAKICANHLQSFYPETPKALKGTAQILQDQIVSPVRFAESIAALYEKGVRVFVEVGPSTVLTNLVKKILENKPVRVIATNPKRKNGVDAYYQALAELFTLGVNVRMVPSYASLAHSSFASDHAVEERPPMESGSFPSPQESLVYSGVSMGLPGSFKKIFDDDNFTLLCEGRNLIESIPEHELNNMLDLNITRLIKKEGASTFKRLASINDLIRLAGRLGNLNMGEDYLVDEQVLKQMTTNICAGVAAGYEALKDAGIPLVQEWITTSSGSRIPGRLALPKELQDETGIIFASCFTKIEPFIREVSKFIAAKFGNQTRQELMEFYEALILRITDPETKKILTDWFAQHYVRLHDDLGEDGVYQFNSDFMAQFSSLANNRLAQFIGATGPNFQLSAACSSTAYAVTVAESLIRSGHAQRMIVIGAENATSKALLPWIGGGFLTSGAATNEANIYQAAVPFDNRRNGMIIGAGAVGIVIEKEAEVMARGMNGICRLMGTHAFNLAGHQTRIDSKRFSVELNKFISRMERVYRINRTQIASRLLYFSHETYTPKKGGCSQTEKAALAATFGEQFREILVTNTKGMTGHPIGASVEEAVAAKALQYQKVPPVVNYKEPDPELAGLKLSKGGTHSFDYALRMVAGFGGQGNYILMQKIAEGDERIIDQSKYQSWLERISDAKDVSLGLEGRILVAKGRTGWQMMKTPPVNPTYPAAGTKDHAAASLSSPQKAPVEIEMTDRTAAITDQILDIYAAVTKYPKDMLELNMEMEADLGIDTVKQATIFAMIAERFQLTQASDIQLSNYPKIGHIIDLIVSITGASEGTAVSRKEIAASSTDLAYASNTNETEEDRIVEDVLQVISEVTKYPVDMLDLDMEMEADLGIDTVKQATIISYIAEQYGMVEGDELPISALPTIRDIVHWVRQAQGDPISKIGGSPQAVNREQARPVLAATDDNDPMQQAGKTGPDSQPPLPGNKGGIEEAVLGIIAEVTKYPVEMLEREMEMEADLGIDTVKQATIFSILGERFGLVGDQAVNISEYNTIGKVIDFVWHLADGGATAAEAVVDISETMVPPEAGNLSADLFETTRNDLCLQIPVAVESTTPPKEMVIEGKNIWVIGNHAVGVERIAVLFMKEAKSVQTFVFPGMTTPKKLMSLIGELPIQPGAILVDCGDLGQPPKGKYSVQEEKRLLFLNSEARFIFYKALHGKVHQRLRIVYLAPAGVLPGSDRQHKIDAFAGALCGFYKGLRKEWKESTVKVVDFGIAGLDSLDQTFGSMLRREIEAGGADYEIIYSGKIRKTVRLGDLDRAGFAPLSLPRYPHLLITGGANGITAEAALGLARGVKAKFTLIGRTSLPTNISALAAMDEKRLEQVRTEIHQRLKASESKVTPLMVQNEFEKVTKAIAAYHLMEKIEQAGSQVRYFACDVRKSEDLLGVVHEAVRQFGPVHVVIHGAGLERSHLFLDKTLVEFQDVFSVKAEGICNLLRALDLTQLKALITFSSISGRFGNEAQLDYCAANSFLSSVVRMLTAEYPQLHAVSIDWSGWKDLGMAWRNDFVKHHSEAMGVNLIEPARGVQALIEVLMNRFQQEEIVISKGLKGFVEENMILSEVRETPLIDWVSRRDCRVEKAFKVISAKREPLFDHHRLGATPLVPAVAMMEMGAEYHRMLFGERGGYCFRNLTVTNPIKLFRDQPQEVFIEPISGEDPGNLELSLNSYFVPKIGGAQLVTHCQMTVSDQPGGYESMRGLTDILKANLREAPFGEVHASPKWQFKNNIVFGPLFVDEEGRLNNRVAYDQNSLVYTYTIPREQFQNEGYPLKKLLINPCLMDTLFQAAAIHALTQHDRIHLPLSADEMGVVRVPRQVETMRIIARLHQYDGEFGTYDIIMIDAQDNICYYAKNVLVRRINL